MDSSEKTSLRDAVLQQYLEEAKRKGEPLSDIRKELISTSVDAAIRVLAEYQRRLDDRP